MKRAAIDIGALAVALTLVAATGVGISAALFILFFTGM